MADDAILLDGGLADPVFGAQAIFRSLMNAFAEPGTIAEFGSAVTPPGALLPAAAAILAALADHDTPIWLPDADGAAARWLRFHTGAPITSDAAIATFAVAEPGADPAQWGEFAEGTPDFPDRSTTLLLPVEALDGGAPLTLAGPGIEASRVIAPRGLPRGFPAAMQANRARFPLGLDVVLVCGTAALALPRSVRIKEA